MTYPVFIELGPLRVHPHLFFELLAYVTAAFVYATVRRRQGDDLPAGIRWSLVTALAVGAVVGSRLLFWLEDPAATLQNLNPRYLIGGQTIVGGLLGGWLAVELEKRRLGITQPTGDLFAIPIAVGAAIGRIGCLLSGLPDGTYGVATTLPWGVDFGDGIRRHPTAAYESIFFLALAVSLARAPRDLPRGDLFKRLMAAYLTFRLLVDAIKPGVPLALGLTAIQWACVAGLVYLGPKLRHRLSLS